MTLLEQLNKLKAENAELTQKLEGFKDEAQKILNAEIEKIQGEHNAQIARFTENAAHLSKEIDGLNAKLAESEKALAESQKAIEAKEAEVEKRASVMAAQITVSAGQPPLKVSGGQSELTLKEKLATMKPGPERMKFILKNWDNLNK